MDHDAFMGVGGSITQAELSGLSGSERLGEWAVVYRVPRQQQGGGFGDQHSRPLAWAVGVYVDGTFIRIYSSRGQGREWNSLDRLEQWLRAQGFLTWWVRNDFEALGAPAAALPAEF